MKPLQRLSLTLLMLAITFSSCKKEVVKKEEEKPKFDINNPVGYFIYSKQTLSGLWPSIWLLEFRPGKTLKLYEASPLRDGQIISYEVIDGNIVSLKGMNYRFLIENGEITSPNFATVALIKAAETDLLSGKTFAGTYYTPEHKVYHEKFFYSFSDKEKKVNIGFNVGATVRTETYRTVGNIAAWVDKNGAGDIEFLLLLNGKLEVNYYDNRGIRYYGTFNQQ